MIRTLIAAATLFLLSGCTDNSLAVNNTFKEALFGRDDVQKSAAEIASLPFPSSYVTIGDGAQLFMIMAVVEQVSPLTQKPKQVELSWVSSDRSLINTRNGRLVKTLGLPGNNLAGLSTDSELKDPLTVIGKKPDTYQWSAILDWQPNYRYGYKANLSWHIIGEDSLVSDAWEKEVLYYQETVSIPSLGVKYTNHFWLDKQNHKVVKSIQHLGPEMPAITMTILQPYKG